MKHTPKSNWICFFGIVLGQVCIGISTNVFAQAEAAKAAKANLDSPAVFRFNLSTEPSHADPARINSSESNYFLFNLHRGLYSLSASGIPMPEVAERCAAVGKKQFRCTIKRTAKWSDGSAIVADDFVHSWRKLVSKDAKGFGVQFLANVKNAVPSHQGLLPATQLGVRALNSHELQIELLNEDSDFLSKLAHPALAVTRREFEFHREAFRSAKAPIPTSGPYFIKDWSKSDRVGLSPNPYYSGIRNGVVDLKRPEVEILFISDDETALNLYREGTLHYLRRLPTHYIKAWESSPELFHLPVMRFDYIGFGPELKDQKELRRALASALRYEELQRLYSSMGVPGCPGLPTKWMSTVPCHRFDVERARALIKNVPVELKNRRFQLGFSKLGGDDIEKGMQWAQAQWKKHLQVQVELNATEQAVYVAQLRSSPPAIFRKGVGLDRASCLAALEIFTKGDGENYIRFDNVLYEAIVRELRTMKSDTSKGRELCSRGIQVLIDEAAIIPLGQIHFTVLAKSGFSGWTLTPLNQLDLGQLNTGQNEKSELK